MLLVIIRSNNIEIEVDLGSDKNWSERSLCRRFSCSERSGHYFWHYFSSFFLSGSHTFLPEGVVLGL